MNVINFSCDASEYATLMSPSLQMMKALEMGAMEARIQTEVDYLQSELIDFQKREYTTISGRKTTILSRNSIMASSDSEDNQEESD